MLERDIAPGIHRVEDAYTNWYLVEDGSDVLIVDCGLPASWKRLPGHLAAIGRAPGDVAAAVLTHAHPDHIGFAERIRTEWDVHVWLHERDRSLSRHPFRYETEHSVARHRNLHVLRVGAAMARNGALGTQPIGDVRAFASGDGELDLPGRPRVVFTPGHTHGHTAFAFRDRGAIIVGDALATLEPYTGERGPRLVSGAANADSVAAMASLQRIAESGARTVLVGHGPAWTGGAQEAVDRAREHAAA
jgi:glyoxylase-like metal-dependent hydrolase (beta-lactamase superfamily II)